MILDELKSKAEQAIELAKGITKGPWIEKIETNDEGDNFWCVEIKDSTYPESLVEMPDHEEDAKFIAASRTLLPDLAEGVLELIEKLKVADVALEDAIEKISSEYCSHGVYVEPSECGPDNEFCYAREQYQALKKIRGEADES